MNYRGYFTDKNGNKYFPISNPKFTGERNKVYLLGRMYANPTSGGSAGQLVLYISNMQEYGGIAGFANINSSGRVVISTIVPWTLSSFKKIFYVYSDGTYLYVFIYAPNYNDNWYVEILSKYNIYGGLSWISYSYSEFQDYVKDMTLVSSA